MEIWYDPSNGQVMAVYSRPYTGTHWSEQGYQRATSAQRLGRGFAVTVRDGRVTGAQPVSRPDAERLAEAKARQLRAMTAARARILSELTAEVDGATYDADEESLKRMTLAIQLWESAVADSDPRAPQAVEWLDADNLARTLTLAELKRVAATCGLAWQTVWARNTRAKVAIQSARTVQAVEAVEF